MLLYNVTVNIDLEKEKEYVEWMKETHISEVMATGLFVDSKFFRLLHEAEEGVNFSVQYFAESMDQIQQYQAQHAAGLQQKLKDKFGNHYVVFRSLLELVE
ncbi:MAG TPA: DUF4286 family protein [Cyclobacteriaceae bacterium]|nr:DUF4286 family protein [Cyclobacteriaceae bacterium]